MKKKKMSFGMFVDHMDTMSAEAAAAKPGEVEAMLDMLIKDLRELVEDENLRRTIDELPEAPKAEVKQETKV